MAEEISVSPKAAALIAKIGAQGASTSTETSSLGGEDYYEGAVTGKQAVPPGGDSPPPVSAKAAAFIKSIGGEAPPIRGEVAPGVVPSTRAQALIRHIETGEPFVEPYPTVEPAPIIPIKIVGAKEPYMWVGKEEWSRLTPSQQAEITTSAKYDPATKQWAAQYTTYEPVDVRESSRYGRMASVGGGPEWRAYELPERQWYTPLKFGDPRALFGPWGRFAGVFSPTREEAVAAYIPGVGFYRKPEPGIVKAFKEAPIVGGWVGTSYQYPYLTPKQRAWGFGLAAVQTAAAAVPAARGAFMRTPAPALRGALLESAFGATRPITRAEAAGAVERLLGPEAPGTAQVFAGRGLGSRVGTTLESPLYRGTFPRVPGLRYLSRTEEMAGIRGIEPTGVVTSEQARWLGTTYPYRTTGFQVREGPFRFPYGRSSPWREPPYFVEGPVAGVESPGLAGIWGGGVRVPVRPVVGGPSTYTPTTATMTSAQVGRLTGVSPIAVAAVVPFRVVTPRWEPVVVGRPLVTPSPGTTPRPSIFPLAPAPTPIITVAPGPSPTVGLLGAPMGVPESAPTPDLGPSLVPGLTPPLETSTVSVAPLAVQPIPRGRVPSVFGFGFPKVSPLQGFAQAFFGGGGPSPRGIWGVKGMGVYAPHPLEKRVAGRVIGRREIPYGAVSRKRVGIVGSRLDGGKLGQSTRNYKVTVAA